MSLLKFWHPHEHLKILIQHSKTAFRITTTVKSKSFWDLFVCKLISGFCAKWLVIPNADCKPKYYLISSYDYCQTACQLISAVLTRTAVIRKTKFLIAWQCTTWQEAKLDLFFEFPVSKNRSILPISFVSKLFLSTSHHGAIEIKCL